MPTKFYSEEEFNDVFKMKESLLDYTRSLGEYFQYDVQKSNNAKDVQDKYPYIPMAFHTLYAQIKTIRDIVKQENKSTYNLQFVDAGSGIGLVMSIAKSLGFVVSGIEYCKEMADMTNRSIGRTIHGDILNQDYSKYDIVYYYHPFRSPEQQKKFEALVESQVKIGAFIIANLKECTKFRTSKKFEVVHFDGYIDGGRNCILRRVGVNTKPIDGRK